MAEPSSYERILDRMEQRGRRFERRGPDWSKVSCPGPSHKRGDRNPSLLIRRQPGRVRLRCYLPGCEDVDILAAIGFEVRDLFDDRREVRYPYEDGWTVHRSWDPKAGKKKIWQEGPESKTNGQPTQLYKLSETKAAVAAHKTILLVEGEDNADLINSLPEEERVGAFATSARMGADSFYLCDVEPLRGAWVLAVVDRDESGDDWARQVRAKVGGLAASLDFKRAKVEKERADAADHIMHGYSLDQLEPYTFPANPLLARKRTGSWLDAQIFAPLQWVIPDIIPEGYTLASRRSENRQVLAGVVDRISGRRRKLHVRLDLRRPTPTGTAASTRR